VDREIIYCGFSKQKRTSGINKAAMQAKTQKLVAVVVEVVVVGKFGWP
jgi:hypothetical protein